MNELTFLEEAIAAANQSGKSHLVERYEQELSRFFGASRAIAVNSGSAALQVALEAAGACAGKRVAVSAMAPLPTLMPIAATGAAPLFIDSQPRNLSMDPLDLARAIDDDVIAAVEVPLWGYPQNYSEIEQVLEDAGVPLIEDAAQAHGATIDGRHLGTLGQIGCFSTHHKKLLSTGEGGFILTENPVLYDRMKAYSRLGNLTGASTGMNFKISAFTAAIGLARLSVLDERVRARRFAAAELFRNLPEPLRCELEHCGTPNGYNLVVFAEKTRFTDAFKAALHVEGIEMDTDKYNYRCGYQHILFSAYARDCPNAIHLIDRLIQLPTDTVPISIISEKVARAWSKAQRAFPSTSTGS